MTKEKSKAVLECETMMVDGKCPCGYSYKASETAQNLKFLLGEAHRGIYTQDSKQEARDDFEW